MNAECLGISGRIARFFLIARITPLLALILLLLGAFAVFVTPREEEPQIDVTMANVLIPIPGASVADVERMVAQPAEQVLAQVAGLVLFLSVSWPGVAFFSGPRRVLPFSRFHFWGAGPLSLGVSPFPSPSLPTRDWLPRNLGALEPI